MRLDSNEQKSYLLIKHILWDSKAMMSQFQLGKAVTFRDIGPIKVLIWGDDLLEIEHKTKWLWYNL